MMVCNGDGELIFASFKALVDDDLSIDVNEVGVATIKFRNIESVLFMKERIDEILALYNEEQAERNKTHDKSEMHNRAGR